MNMTVLLNLSNLQLCFLGCKIGCPDLERNVVVGNGYIFCQHEHLNYLKNLLDLIRILSLKIRV